MEHHGSTSALPRNAKGSLVWPKVRSGPLVAGGILTGIGAATWRSHPNAQVRLVRRQGHGGQPRLWASER